MELSVCEPRISGIPHPCLILREAPLQEEELKGLKSAGGLLFVATCSHGASLQVEKDGVVSLNYELCGVQ